MPTYEYRCPEGHEFEKFQRMSDPAEAECPECGADAERMLSGGAGLLFKGEGFYITDYRSDSYRKAAEKEKKGGASGKGAKDSKAAKDSTSARESKSGTESKSGGSGGSGSTGSGDSGKTKGSGKGSGE